MHGPGEAEPLDATKSSERLSKITGAIAAAVAPEEVFEAVVEEVGRALGAVSGALWLVEGDQIVLVRSFGYAEAAQKKLNAIPLDATLPSPALDTIREGAPIWFTSPQQLVERYPHLADDQTHEAARQIACLPMRLGDHIAGTLAFCFDGSPPIDEQERAFLLLVARYSAQALERLRLLDSERKSRAHAERSAARKALLYRMAQSIIEAEDVDEVFAAALETIDRALGTDRSAILALDDDGVMRFKKWRGLSDSYRRSVEGHSPWSRGTTNPQPIIMNDVESNEGMASYRPLFRKEGICALGFFPLVAGGRLLGEFTVYSPRPIALASSDLEMAKAIANHVAAAIARFSSVRKLEETIRFNELFTGVLGHDLRNPLTAILTAAHTAIAQDEGGKLEKPLRRIISSGDRMTRMIAQLLDFTRVRVGAGIVLTRVEVDLALLLQQVLDELRYANPDCTFEFECKGEKQGIWDQDRLYQVFSNLLANATQHGHPGGRVRVLLDGTTGVTRVEIHNRGAVPRDLLPHLFEPLAGLKRKLHGSEGLGLGLFISDQIVRAHAGSVEVRSSEGEGTTFVVSLPRGPTAGPLYGDEVRSIPNSDTRC